MCLVVQAPHLYLVIFSWFLFYNSILFSDVRDKLIGIEWEGGVRRSVSLDPSIIRAVSQYKCHFLRLQGFNFLPLAKIFGGYVGPCSRQTCSADKINTDQHLAFRLGHFYATNHLPRHNLSIVLPKRLCFLRTQM